MTRLKLAELTSGVGALVLGLGLGALLSRLGRSRRRTDHHRRAGHHAVGMWDKHRLESEGGAKSPAWVVALYSACWLLLAALLVVLLFWIR